VGLLKGAVVLILAAAANGLGDDTGSSVIAQVGGRQIRYFEVRCPVADSAASGADQGCLKKEREIFRAKVIGEIHRGACALEGWSPSEADIAPHRPSFIKNESEARDVAEKASVLPRAVRRVYLGEEVTSVYPDVARVFPNMSIEKFRESVKFYQSLAVVDRLLAKDPVVRIREAVDTFCRDAAMQDHLHNRIEARAAAAGRTFDEEADEYLQFLVKQLPIRIVDERFRLPPGREVFR
jgi:hypothetical protein